MIFVITVSIHVDSSRHALPTPNPNDLGLKVASRHARSRFSLNGKGCAIGDFSAYGRVLAEMASATVPAMRATQQTSLLTDGAW